MRETFLDMGATGSHSPKKFKEERSPGIFTWVINDPQIIN